VSINYDSKIIAINKEENDDRKVSLWEFKNDETIKPKEDNPEIFDINTKIAEFNPNKNQLATVEIGEEGDIIKLWDISEKKPWDIFKKESKPIEIKTEQKNVDLIAFPNKGDLLVSRGKEKEDDGTNDGKTTIKLWQLKNNNYQKKPFLYNEFDEFQKKQNIYSVAFSRDGKFIATTTTDNNNVQVWETDGVKNKEFPTQQKDAYVAFSPDGKQLATGGEGGILQLWDIEANPKERFKTQLRTIYSILFSPDGNKLVITGRSEDSNNNKLKLFDLSGNELKQFETPLESESIKRVKFSQDGKLLITVANSGEVRLWQVGDVKELMKLVCKFSKDYLKSSSDKGDRNLCD
jgi:WD40 repeat protein